MERKVCVNYPPRRIISLVPSQTELLFDLGLDEEVAGITKFCVHPAEKWRAKPRVGGTKKLHLEKIAALNPDLVIGNKEENDREQIETLEKTFPVWMSDVCSLEDACRMIESVGELVGKEAPAQALCGKISEAFRELKAQERPPTAAYLIWRKPWMVAAAGTFIDSMVEAAGFKNIFFDKTRYPEITLEALGKRMPQTVLLSSEPYPFKQNHVEEIRKHCPSAVVTLVDGEMFSWYGSRLLQAAGYFATLRNCLK
jgi:ABC-type Fe3+-hydroxamate transport system substrate-binding protein